MKSKKITKIIGAGGLAIIMCAGVLCGTLIGPMNSTHATTSGATSASNSGDPAALAQSPDRALKLNPQTDETIFTTETGIEIKSHNLSASGAESSIQYFTLGAYNGTPVNWLIVGVSNSGVGIDSTDAGAAISAANANGKLVTGATSSDLLENQILCISEYAFNQATYKPFSLREQYTVTVGKWGISQVTVGDLLSDYGYISSIDVVSNSSILGETLALNEFYGNDGDKIVVNAKFSENFIFSLSALQYSTFLGNTNYQIPYLFDNNMNATGLFTSDILTSKINSYYTVTKDGASGSASANVGYTHISVTGEVNKWITNLSISCDPANFRSFTPKGSTPTFSLAYRPAFVMQL